MFRLTAPHRQDRDLGGGGLEVGKGPGEQKAQLRSGGRVLRASPKQRRQQPQRICAVPRILLDMILLLKRQNI